MIVGYGINPAGMTVPHYRQAFDGASMSPKVSRDVGEPRVATIPEPSTWRLLLMDNWRPGRWLGAPKT